MRIRDIIRKRRATRNDGQRLLQSLEDRSLYSATPTVTLDFDNTGEMIDESFEFSALFDNTAPLSTETGFGPYIDLHVKPGFQINSASLIGTNVSITLAGEFNSSGDLIVLGSGDPGTITSHPLLETPVTGGTPGDLLYVLELPVGSVTVDQPILDVEINATLSTSDGAIPGIPLAISAQGGFQYGEDALDNPIPDPPILGAADSDSVTPVVILIDKDSASETATGPNFARTYTLRIDIADGATVDNIDIRDILPNTLEYKSGTISITPGGSVTTEPTSPGPQNPPSNQLLVEYASFTGTASDSDIIVTYQAFVPEFDADLNDVIDPLSGDDVSVVNESSVSGDYGVLPVSHGTDSPSGVFDNDDSDWDLIAKSIAIQKGLVHQEVNAVTGVNPGDKIEYTLSFQVSDFFEFDDIIIDDVLDDGLRFDATFAPTMAFFENGTTLSATAIDAANFTETINSPGDGSTNLQFRVSDELVTRGADSILTGDLYAEAV
ncbi:MAG: hypothetical protein ACI9G1_004304 [Pirellulaceae bacterium]|jgi:hypothetical protein